MAEKCSCRVSAEAQLEYALEEARRAQRDRLKRLSLFREGIRDGAHEVAARRLFMAGVYGASLDNGLAKDPDDGMIHEALARRVEDREKLYRFYGENRMLVQEQGRFLNVERVLRGVLRRRRGVEGRLTARAMAELDNAVRALDRLDRLGKMLETWREGLRLESRVALEVIVDMHEHSQPTLPGHSP
uniref:Uncharacterized protein n=1 Tax=viral metagenome TaxID=1070528 RepID=A0A6M3M2E8_9ZZZZ